MKAPQEVLSQNHSIKGFYTKFGRLKSGFVKSRNLKRTPLSIPAISRNLRKRTGLYEAPKLGYSIFSEVFSWNAWRSHGEGHWVDMLQSDGLYR